MTTTNWSIEDDDLLGRIDLHVDRAAGLVELRPAAGPPVRLERTGTGLLDERSLIGAREAERLSLLVGGIEADIRPGRGLVTRRSFRVDVRLDATAYRLLPVGRHTSVLSRDGARIGRVQVVPDVPQVDARWARGARPVDAALGHLLALAFGTGSLHPAYVLFEFALCLVPF